MMPAALIHVLFDVVTRDNDRDRARRAATRSERVGAPRTSTRATRGWRAS